MERERDLISFKIYQQWQCKSNYKGWICYRSIQFNCEGSELLKLQSVRCLRCPSTPPRRTPVYTFVALCFAPLSLPPPLFWKILDPSLSCEWFNFWSLRKHFHVYFLCGMFVNTDFLQDTMYQQMHECTHQTTLPYKKSYPHLFQ